jgi:HAD superfamily hydrolase (TIGR01509 family)
LVFFVPEQNLIVQDALCSVGVQRSEEEIRQASQLVAAEYYRDAATVRFPATKEYDDQSQVRFGLALLDALGVQGDGPTLRTYTAALETWFARPGVLRLYPEVAGVLDSLQRRDVRLGIVSNWSWNLKDRVSQVGLDGYFEVVWASAYAGCNKPHPEIFYQAMDKMGLTTERVLYVGDSYEHDVVGALNAGLDVVLLDRLGTSPVDDVPVIRDLRDLYGHLGDTDAGREP